MVETTLKLNKTKEIPKQTKVLFYFAKTYIQKKPRNTFMPESLVKNAIYFHGFAGFTHLHPN